VSILHDIRFCLRQLRAAPGFTATALLSLALGIGAAVTMFSAFRAVFLAELPYRDAGQLVEFVKSGPHDRNVGTRFADFQFLRENARSFSQFARYGGFDTRTMVGAGEPINLVVRPVSGELFPLLGSVPLMGRTIGPGDSDGVVLSYKTWQTIFQGDRGVIGRQVLLNRESYTIVGVMPPSFQFPQPLTQAWLPDRTPVTNPFENGVAMIGRLKPGVALEQARQEVENLTPALAATYPAALREWKFALTAIVGSDSATYRTPFQLLLGAVGLLLLIACLNISNLLLARASAREAEFALRGALGAGRARLILQALTESLVLASFGGLLGTAFAYASNRVLIHALPTQVGVPRLEQSSLDGQVLLVAIALATITGVLFGIVPAIALSKKALAQSDRTLRSTSGLSSRFGTLLAGEVSLALILLAGSVLMIRGFVRLANVDPGFRTAHVLAASVPPNRTARLTQAEAAQRYGSMLEAAQRVPGVEAAALASAIPLGRVGVAIDFQMPDRSRDAYRAQYHAVSIDYFSVMGIPLKRGRIFDARDTGATHAVIVNEAMAHQFWPDIDPVGQHLGQGLADTVVGVVGNTKLRDLAGAPVAEMYEPYQQYFGPALGAALVLRTYGDPVSVAGGLRAAIHGFDSEQVVESVSALEDLVSGSIGQSRFYTTLMAVFAVLALTLTLIGVYGVASYATNRRAREMGIRMAVGAERGDLMAMILRQGLVSVSFGIVAGLAGAWFLARYMASMVYGVPVRDPLSLGIAAAILVIGALAAYFVPAFRITRIDPAAVLRHE
jgi:putative ABC transport system permease protein